MFYPEKMNLADVLTGDSVFTKYNSIEIVADNVIGKYSDRLLVPDCIKLISKNGMHMV